MSDQPSIRGVNSRHVAAKLMLLWLKSGAFPDRLLDRVHHDHAFIMEMVLGSVRQFRALEWLVGRLALRKTVPELGAYAFVGLYQIFFMDQVEAYAAVNETVRAAKAEMGQRAANWVNAILRRAMREKSILLQDLEKASPAVRLSHPDVLFDRWTRYYDAARAQQLCAWNNGTPDVILRVNGRRSSVAAVLDLLKTKELPAEVHPFRPQESVRLAHGVRVSELPGYGEGLFSVQDPSTSVAADLLDPQPGEVVLDACAAPGGKTGILAEKLDGKGRLVAMDVHDNRLDRLRENARRLGWSKVDIVQGDAANVESMDAVLRATGGATAFDRILLDVPCSNTGVIRRRPDARWRFSANNLVRLNATQKAILSAAFSKVRPGGCLVYSTCSLEPEENEDLVRIWAANRPDARLISERRLFPPEAQTDGAYAALIRREEGVAKDS